MMMFILRNMIVAASMFASASYGETVLSFDSEPEFSTQFTVVAAGSGTISYSTGAGVAGRPGRVNVSVTESSGKMIYGNQPFSLRNGPLSFSFHFLADEFTGSSNARIALGISPDMVNLRGGVRAQARLINKEEGAASFEIRSAADGAVSTSGVTLMSGKWYRLEATFSLSETTDGIDVTARLIDCGATGSMAQSITAEASGTRIENFFFENGEPKDVFVGFLVQNADGGGDAIDEIRFPGFSFSDSTQLGFFDVVAEGTAGSIVWTNATGVGQIAGRVDMTGITANSGKGLYSTAQTDPDEGKIGASFFFRAVEFVNNGNYSRVALGLSPDQKKLLGNSEVQARLIKSSSGNTGLFEIRGGTGSGTFGVELTDGNWYRLSAVFAPYGTQSFQVNAVLEDYGPAGSNFVSRVASASAIKTAPSDFFDGSDRLPLSVGILVQNDGGGGDAIDQVQVSGPTGVSPSKGPNLFSWRTAMGTHYRIYTNAFMGTVRSFPTPSKLSYFPDVTALSPTNITPVTGRFSGDLRYYDFEDVLGRETIGHDYGEYLRQAEAAKVDLIWNLGQIHHSHSGHVGLIMTNNGAYYKDLVYQAVLFANSGEFENSSTTVYWEIGNEINSHFRFSLSDYGEFHNNVTNAADYLEYYLAPAVEAIQAASYDLYGESKQVKALLANVTFLRDTNTQIFLRTVLDGTVVGTHAPTLAGKKGHELVETIGLHYSLGTASVLDTYYNEWVASGKVSGMWNTEEHGWAGLGDYDIALHGFRWLDFWAQKSWSSETARLQFWGDQVPTSRERTDGLSSDTTGENMEFFLGQLLQSYPLMRIEPGDIVVSAAGNPEKYGFWAELPGGGYRSVLVLAAKLDWNLSSLNLAVPGSLKYCEAYIQPVETERSLWGSSWQESGGNLTVTFPSPALRREDAVVVVIETLP
jgi:hypothetical protein